MIRKKSAYFSLLVLCGFWVAVVSGYAADNQPSHSTTRMTLARAVMCEYIEEFAPQRVAVVFSINAGKISCFTSFDDIKASTYALHKWYRRDQLVTSKRLTLKPPSWSTYSSIQLREADKGPWRVEIINNRNQLIKTLRFSVTD